MRVASWHSAFPLLLKAARSSSKLRLRFYGHSHDTHPQAPESTIELFFLSSIVNHIGIFLKNAGS